MKRVAGVGLVARTPVGCRMLTIAPDALPPGLGSDPGVDRNQRQATSDRRRPPLSVAGLRAAGVLLRRPSTQARLFTVEGKILTVAPTINFGYPRGPD